MPKIPVSYWQLDYDVTCEGRPLILLHSSLSGNKQWKPISKKLEDRHQVFAPSFFGYGKTSPWPGEKIQTIDDQLDLIAPVFADHESFDIVGHSLGGAVALKAALRFSEKVRKLVFIEPTQYNLTANIPGCVSYAEISGLLNVFEDGLVSGDWMLSAEAISNFWHGPQAWAGMSEHHRIAVTWRMPPVVHELRAILSSKIPVEALRTVTADTLVMRARTTVPAIEDVFQVLTRRLSQWTYLTLETDGHMFPVSDPHQTYLALQDFLGSH